MVIECITVGEIQANCYVVACETTKKAIVVDPGAEGSRIADYLIQQGYELEIMVATHGHFDHIGASDYLRERFQAKMAIHSFDACMLADPMKNLSGLFPGYTPATFRPADVILHSGDKMSVGTISLDVLHTPGHTPGSICLVGSGVLLSGDTLFRNGVGATDLPGGDFDLLSESLNSRVFVLDDDIRVYPGHGPSTTIGRERARG